MLASILILAVSAVLLVYWFRYTCLLVLRARGEAGDSVLRANGLTFGQLAPRLREAEVTALDPIQASLERDYRVLTYLLDHAPGLRDKSIEERLLVLDYRAMKCWYSLTRTAAPAQARAALSEMIEILGFLAHQMSERAQAGGRA